MYIKLSRTRKKFIIISESICDIVTILPEFFISNNNLFLTIKLKL